MQRLQQRLMRWRALLALIGSLAVLALMTTALAFTVGGAPSGAVAGVPTGRGAPTGQRLTMNKAQQDLQAALMRTGNSDLRLSEIMEFTNNFYAIAKVRSTGMRAFEALVDPYSSVVYPEYGPNMMRNAEYGMAGMMGSSGGGPQGPSGDAYHHTVSAARAQRIAQQWLDRSQAGSTIGTARLSRCARWGSSPAAA